MGEAWETTWDEDESHAGLFLVVAIFIAVLSWTLARRYHVQGVVIMMLFGAAWRTIVQFWHMGAIGNSLMNWMNISSPELLLYMFLPGLIFGGSFNADFHVFTHSLPNILWLAFPGVLVCAILQALIPVLWYSWDWAPALAYGFMLAATDPVSVIALLHDLGAPTEVSHLMEGESIINDGTALVGLVVFMDVVHTGDIDAGFVLWLFIRLSLGGFLWGFLTGKLTEFILSRMKFDVLSEVMLTAGSCWGTYLLAETVPSYMNVSGVLACNALGLTLGSATGRSAFSNLGTMVDFWKVVEYLSNTCIFVLTGAFIIDRAVFAAAAHITASDLAYLIVMYLAINVIRALIMFGSLPLLQRWGYGCTWQEALVLSYAGVRGAIALVGALVLSDDESLPEDMRQRIIFSTCGIVALTLTVNSGTVSKLVNLLKVTAVPPERQRLFRDAMLDLLADVNKAAADMMVPSGLHPQRWRLLSEQFSKYFFQQLGLSAEESELSVVKDSQVHAPDEDFAVESESSQPVPTATVDEETKTSHDVASNDFRASMFSVSAAVDQKHSSQTLQTPYVRKAATAAAQQDVPLSLMKAARRKLLNVVKAQYWAMFDAGEITKRSLAVLVDATRRGQDGSELPLFEWDIVLNNVTSNSFFGVNRKTRRMLGCIPLSFLPEMLQQKLLYGPLVFQYDLVSAFVKAHEAALSVFKPSRESEAVLSAVAFEIQTQLDRARVFHSEMEHSYPEIVETIQAERALAALLRAARGSLSRLTEAGELDDRETHSIEHALQETTLAAKMPISPPPTVEQSLDKVGLLTALSDADRAALLTCAEPATFRPGDVLVAQGTSSAGFFVIVRGSVALYRSLGTPDTGASTETPERVAVTRSTSSLTLALSPLSLHRDVNARLTQFMQDAGGWDVTAEDPTELQVEQRLGAGNLVGAMSILTGEDNFFTARAAGFVDALFFSAKHVTNFLVPQVAGGVPLLLTHQFEANVARAAALFAVALLDDFRAFKPGVINRLVATAEYVRPVPMRPFILSSHVLVLTGSVLQVSRPAATTATTATAVPAAAGSTDNPSAELQALAHSALRLDVGVSHRFTREARGSSPEFVKGKRVKWLQDLADMAVRQPMLLQAFAFIRADPTRTITFGDSTRLLLMDPRVFTMLTTVPATVDAIRQEMYENQ